MFHSHKHLSILFAGIFGLLLLSGCGSDDEEKQKDATETGQTDQSATEPAGNQQTPTTETGEPAGTAGSSTPKWEAPTTAGDSVAHPYVTDDFHAAIIVRAKNLYESELMKQIRALDKDGIFEDAMVISLNRETGVDIRDVQRFSLFNNQLKIAEISLYINADSSIAFFSKLLNQFKNYSMWLSIKIFMANFRAYFIPCFII